MQLSGIGTTGVIGRFYRTLEEFLAAGWATKLGMLFGSNQASETYKWLSAVPAMREWSGHRAAESLVENGLTITNKKFESTIEIDSDDFRRDKTGQIIARINDLAMRAGPQHWEKLLTTLIVNGTGATSGYAYDGQYFFDTDHSEGRSGTQKNLLTSSEVASLNVGSATAPNEYEMAAAIRDVIAYMFGFKDSAGEQINGQARSFLVMVPISLYGTALAATKNPTVVGTSGAVSANPLAATPFTVDVVPNGDAAFTWTDAFSVFRTDGQVRPFILQEEVSPTMEAVGAGSEYEKINQKQWYGVKAIRNVGYGMWQSAAKATLS